MIAIGKLVKAVGLKGEVKLYPYSPDPSCYDGCRLVIDGTDYILKQFRLQKGMGFLKLASYDTLESVEELIGHEVFMDRRDITLEEDEYLIADLIGLQVISTEGEALGVIQEVLSPAGHDVYVVQGESEILIPAVDEFIKSVDLDQGQMIVQLIEGLR